MLCGVRCCLQPALLKLLASLGAGFDCASKAELEAVLALGVPTERIIFAHPCKRPCDLRFARDAGIQVRSLLKAGHGTVCRLLASMRRFRTAPGTLLCCASCQEL